MNRERDNQKSQGNAEVLRLVSGLVSEEMVCRRNPFQTFAAIETIEVTPDSGLPVIRGVKVGFDLGVVG